jgi:hypothetical protein
MARKAATITGFDELTALWPGRDVARSAALLKALGILTPDGRLNQDSRRKLKQVLHLWAQIRVPMESVWASADDPILADLGAGKSYLGLVLYDLFVGPAERGRVVGVEVRPKLNATARAIAAAAGFDRATFLDSSIADAQAGGPVAAVTALHACDTATDDAIQFALRHQAKLVVLVPCCQAEAARQLEDAGEHALRQLWRHPIQRREFGSHITNVIRALVLEAAGYKVRVTELTGWEHSLKNELIVAERHQTSNPLAARHLRDLLRQFPVRPSCVQDDGPKRD